MFLRLILLKLPRQCTDGNGWIERYGETQLTLDKTGAFKQTLLNKALDLLLLSHMFFFWQCKFIIQSCWGAFSIICTENGL